MSLQLAPLNQRTALAFVQMHHRHNKPPRGAKFQVAAVVDEEIDARPGWDAPSRPRDPLDGTDNVAKIRWRAAA